LDGAFAIGAGRGALYTVIAGHSTGGLATIAVLSADIAGFTGSRVLVTGGVFECCFCAGAFAIGAGRSGLFTICSLIGAGGFSTISVDLALHTRDTFFRFCVTECIADRDRPLFATILETTPGHINTIIAAGQTTVGLAVVAFGAITVWTLTGTAFGITDPLFHRGFVADTAAVDTGVRVLFAVEADSQAGFGRTVSSGFALRTLLVGLADTGVIAVFVVADAFFDELAVTVPTFVSSAHFVAGGCNGTGAAFGLENGFLATAVDPAFVCFTRVGTNRETDVGGSLAGTPVYFVAAVAGVSGDLTRPADTFGDAIGQFFGARLRFDFHNRFVWLRRFIGLDRLVWCRWLVWFDRL
jgi:threonine dehydrogenase-like Zn-dependent dehydrogenase